jgi:acetyl-CoA carboxylase biotin carboxyl carrier protein
VNADRIKQIIEMMKDNHLAEFELEEGDFKIRIRRGPSDGQQVAMVGAHLPTGLMAAHLPSLANSPPPPSTENVLLIKSPMVGTYYRRPSPDAKVYVEIGDEVNPDTVVCIIEAMKVMNEIKAECGGTITEICAENMKPVEFGKVMFKVKPKSA